MISRLSILLWACATLLLADLAGAVNFTTCFAEVQNGTFGLHNPGAVDEFGNPAANASDAVGITYSLCVTACGTGVQPFQWSFFSQSFSAWLLPWLALISQLPFGAKHRTQNLMSAVLAVGSPTLAGYAIMLTILNSRYVASRFSGITYPNAKEAFRILSSLQQAALEVDESLLPSLVVLSNNDEWWEDLADRLNYVHTWSISAAASIAWVFIAYIFTVIDTFISLADELGPGSSGEISDGQAVGSLWLWLLAVVIGWLQISPKCDDGTVKTAMKKANREAYIASDDVSPMRASEKSNAWAMYLVEERDGDNEDGARDDERASPPIYNYARFLPWTQNVERVVSAFRNADSKANKHIPADASSIWHVADKYGEINPMNRNGTINQLHNYCADPVYLRRSQWGSHVWSRFFLSACAGLALQWGTVGGSLVIMIFTPTKGLGCRSATYLFYACLSTVVWFLLMISSFLVHASSSVAKRGSRVAMRQASIWLRRFAKSLAILNTSWVIGCCILQFSNVYNTCFCDVQLLSLIKHAYSSGFDTIIMTPDLVAGLKAPWTGGIALGCMCTFLYLLFINLFINPRL